MSSAFYTGMAAELLARLRRLSSFTGHGPSIGATHEEFVREAIRPFLSRRFSLRSGFLLAREGVVSPQADILIIDESDPAPYLYQLGDLVVVHPRAVAFVIEVKTYLSRSDFLDSLTALRACRDVAKVAEPPGVFLTAVFAFESTRFTPDTLDEWYKASSIPDDVLSYPQIIYSLTQGALDLKQMPGAVFGHRFLIGEEGDETKARTLSLFLHVVRKALEMKAGMETNTFEFADLTGLHWSRQYLRLGVGLVDDAAQQ